MLSAERLGERERERARKRVRERTRGGWGSFGFKVDLLLMWWLLEKPVRFRERGDGRAVRLIVYFSSLCSWCLFL